MDLGKCGFLRCSHTRPICQSRTFSPGWLHRCSQAEYVSKCYALLSEGRKRPSRDTEGAESLRMQMITSPLTSPLSELRFLQITLWTVNIKTQRRRFTLTAGALCCVAFFIRFNFRLSSLVLISCSQILIIIQPFSFKFFDIFLSLILFFSILLFQ